MLFLGGGYRLNIRRCGTRRSTNRKAGLQGVKLRSQRHLSREALLQAQKPRAKALYDKGRQSQPSQQQTFAWRSH